MVSRFQKRGAPPEVTFFVFQDILTSMIGVLIIITLTLALRLDGPMGTGAPGAGAGGAQNPKAQLDALLAEITRLRAQLEAAHWGNKGGQLSESALESELASLRKQIALYSEANSSRENKAQKLSYDPNADLWEGEIAGMRFLLKKAKTESDNLEAKLREEQAKAQSIQDQVKAAESSVDAERKRLNILRLIPEKSATNKSPILVVLDRTGYTILGNQAGAGHGGNPEAFRTALKQLDTHSQYIVFFVKPSAADEFTAYKNTAGNAAFEVGYDVVSEDITLEVAAP